MRIITGRTVTFALRALLGLGVAVGFWPILAEETAYFTLEAPEHRYWDTPLRDDPFTLLTHKLESGEVVLDASGGELGYLRSLLEALKIPVSSQLLVFSTTSLQLRFISPRNPRAIYFNENVAVGYIPGGKIEIISIDPKLGAIFYIFDIPAGNQIPVAERSDRCMNCHSGITQGRVPTLTTKSVIPGVSGGSIIEYRKGVFGHGVPLADRLGGWFVTGEVPEDSHQGNRIGRFENSAVVTTAISAETSTDLNKYLLPSSDLLPHLVREHQLGFINRCIELNYRARSYEAAAHPQFLPEHKAILKDKAADLVRYLLYADEIPLPAACRESSGSAFAAAFAQAGVRDSKGRSLRDFDLQTRMFSHRCSYLIHSLAYMGLPEWVRKEVSRQVRTALDPEHASPEYSYLAPMEKRTIAEILAETWPDWQLGAAE